MDETDHPIEYKSKNNATNNSIIETVKTYLATEGFRHKIIGDTPTDNNQLTPRKYVNLNGISANRPTSSIIGQFYYDTTIHMPIWWDGVSFKDSQGNVV